MDTGTVQNTRIKSEQTQQRQKSAPPSSQAQSGADNAYTAISRGSDILVINSTPFDDILSFNFLGGNSRG